MDTHRCVERSRGGNFGDDRRGLNAEFRSAPMFCSSPDSAFSAPTRETGFHLGDDGRLYSGTRRTRVPVALKTAFASAAATGGTAGSPTPVGASVLRMSRTSIRGVSRKRNTG